MNDTLMCFKRELEQKVDAGTMEPEDAYEALCEAQFKETALVEEVEAICKRHKKILDKGIRYTLIKDEITKNWLTRDYYEDAIKLAIRIMRF